MGDSIRLLGCFEAGSAIFWIATVLAREPTQPWGLHQNPAEFLTLVALISNAVAAAAASTWSKSEAAARILVISYMVLLITLTCLLATSHPHACLIPEDAGIEANMLTHLLWTADACMLSLILGWVSIAAGSVAAFYIGGMVTAYWHSTRAAGEEARIVSRAIAAFPVLKFDGKQTPLLQGHNLEDTSTCSICLLNFEGSEALRLLPCDHVYHRACIDQWIRRQGLNASCPLCKRDLIPQPICTSEGRVGSLEEYSYDGGSNASISPLSPIQVVSAASPRHGGPSSEDASNVEELADAENANE